MYKLPLPFSGRIEWTGWTSSRSSCASWRRAAWRAPPCACAVRRPRSRALAALEDRLGVRLVDRTTRRLAPTEAGRAFYDKARGLTADYEAATAGARDAPVRGPLRITAPVQFGCRHIAPVVARFLDAQAGVEVELLLADRNIDLIDEGIDVALRIGRLADLTLSARLVGQRAAALGGKPGLFQAPRHAADAGRPGGSRGDPGNGARQQGVELRRPAHRAAPDGAAASTTSRPACAPRARAAAWPSSCPTRWPTSWPRTSWCACCSLSAAAAGALVTKGRPSRAQDRRLRRVRRQAAEGAARAARPRLTHVVQFRIA